VPEVARVALVLEAGPELVVAVGPVGRVEQRVGAVQVEQAVPEVQ
jgi:hypothetical protein